MDREAAVIREQMSQTRADLDQKLGRLEARARELKPSAVARRYVPSYALDRTLGALLTVVGARLAWAQYRNGTNRRDRLRAELEPRLRW
jgi:hypothetical protein